MPASLEPHLRTAWLPQCTEGEGEPRGARFGGRAWLPEGMQWPTCTSCGHAMHLFAQLPLAELPGEAPVPDSGLLQLFYCTNSEPLCEVDLESYAPFGRAVVARIVDAEGPGRLGEAASVYPAQAVVDWRPVLEPPGWEEADALGVELDDDTWDAVHEEGLPHAGDKWLGWPAWIQGVEYPECRTCGRAMALLLQIDSEDHVPYMFGDSGTGHLMVCPDHPAELSFHWACC